METVDPCETEISGIVEIAGITEAVEEDLLDFSEVITTTVAVVVEGSLQDQEDDETIDQMGREILNSVTDSVEVCQDPGHGQNLGIGVDEARLGVCCQDQNLNPSLDRLNVNGVTLISAGARPKWRRR